MEIEELVKKKRSLESKLTSAISNLIAEFRRDTGYSPCCINVNLIAINSYGEMNFNYTVSNVKVDLSIGGL